MQKFPEEFKERIEDALTGITPKREPMHFEGAHH
jgi:hypothetical protein